MVLWHHKAKLAMKRTQNNAIATKGHRYTIAQMVEALTVTKGMVSLAAKRLGCAPDTVYRYIKEYPDVAAAKYAEREAVTDMAELSLYKAIQQGEAWAVCFYLKTQGKGRGYVERQEIDHRIRNVAELSDDELRAIVET